MTGCLGGQALDARQFVVYRRERAGRIGELSHEEAEDLLARLRATKRGG